jgi:ribonuclease P protein component
VSSPERLRSSRDFRRVLSGGTRASAGPIQAVVAPGNPDQARFGVSVGRTIGNAVTRNLVKRRLRSISRTVDLPAGIDVVIVAKPGAAGKTFQEMETLVGDALTRAGARA